MGLAAQYPALSNVLKKYNDLVSKGITSGEQFNKVE